MTKQDLDERKDTAPDAASGQEERPVGEESLVQVDGISGGDSDSDQLPDDADEINSEQGGRDGQRGAGGSDRPNLNLVHPVDNVSEQRERERSEPVSSDDDAGEDSIGGRHGDRHDDEPDAGGGVPDLQKTGEQQRRYSEKHGQHETGSRPHDDDGTGGGPDLRRGKVVPVGQVDVESADDLVPIMVSVANVKKHWKFVVPGLKELFAKNGNPLTLKDVRKVLDENRGWLVNIFHKRTKKHVGWVIVSREAEDQFTGREAFLIWLAFSKVPNVATLIYPFLEEMAVDLGYDDIVIYSPRKGWSRLSKKFGLQLREQVFYKRLKE